MEKFKALLWKFLINEGFGSEEDELEEKENLNESNTGDELELLLASHEPSEDKRAKLSVAIR